MSSLVQILSNMSIGKRSVKVTLVTLWNVDGTTGFAIATLWL